jgi:hypothetical protein
MSPFVLPCGVFWASGACGFVLGYHGRPLCFHGLSLILGFVFSVELGRRPCSFRMQLEGLAGLAGLAGAVWVFCLASGGLSGIIWTPFERKVFLQDAPGLPLAPPWGLGPWVPLAPVWGPWAVSAFPFPNLILLST